MVYSAFQQRLRQLTNPTKAEPIWPPPFPPTPPPSSPANFTARPFAAVSEVEAVSLRYFNVFGPRQDPNSEYSAVIPKFITMMLSGKAPTIFGNGKQSRDFVYVSDVVEANLRAAEAPAEQVSGRVFNVGLRPQSDAARFDFTTQQIARSQREAQAR